MSLQVERVKGWLEDTQTKKSLTGNERDNKLWKSLDAKVSRKNTQKSDGEEAVYIVPADATVIGPDHTNIEDSSPKSLEVY